MGLNAITAALLCLFVLSSFEGGEGAKMKAQMTGSVLRAETVAADGETTSSLAELESNMTYKPPHGRDAETRGVIPDMEELMADPSILGVAYGPAFKGKGSKAAGDQIVAWKYIADKELVVMFYPKTTCRDLELKGCGDKKGNLAGVMTCSACPSCTMSGTMMWGSCNLDEKKRFPAGGDEKIDLGSMAAPGKIVLINGQYKIEVAEGCYFDHAWVKSVGLTGPDATPKCMKAPLTDSQKRAGATPVPCSCTGQTAAKAQTGLL